MPFDYLVIASGSSYTTIIKDENVIAMNRAKKLRDYHEKLKKAKKIVIVGGGVVGIELAAEIMTHFPDKDMTIVEAGKKIMSRQSEKVSRYAQKFLENRNVKIMFGEKITDYNNHHIETDKGKNIHAEIVLMCTGIKPNSSFMKKYFSQSIDEKGFIKTNNFLQLEKSENIFIAGDVAAIREEKLAQNAEHHAKIIIKNIRGLKKDQPLQEYRQKQRIMVISLGKYNGIILYKDFMLTGIVAGILKNLIEWFFMAKYP
jgi:NADH dehydrogenase FAD-containing subunit